MSTQQEKGVKKPTPAQRRWLEAIGKCTVFRTGHSWVNGMRNRGVSPRSSTYLMTLALRDRGWIDEAPNPHGPFLDRWPLVLTEEGRAVIAPPSS